MPKGDEAWRGVTSSRTGLPLHCSAPKSTWGSLGRQPGAGSEGLCYSGMPAKTLGPGDLTGVEKGTELGPELCDSAGHF